MNPHSPLPSLDLLKGFEVVARHLSFTKAAAELYVTQSAVSRQIRQLEEHLGVRLFERRTRAVVLTEAGYRYYSELTPLLRQLAEITHKVSVARTETRVRVTAPLTIASLWLGPRLAVFQERHPDVHVHVVADNVMRDLDRDGLDVAIRYSPRDDAGANAVRLFAETLAPVCSPELAARAKLKHLADIERVALIHFNDLEGRAQWLSWDLYFSQAKHAGVQGTGAVYFSHYDQAIRAARAGQGVVLGRFPAIDTALADGGLVAPFGNSAQVSLSDRAYWLILADAVAAKPGVDRFVQWLRSEAEHSAPVRTAPKTRKTAR